MGGVVKGFQIACNLAGPLGDLTGGFVAETLADHDGLMPLTGPPRSAIKSSM